MEKQKIVEKTRENLQRTVNKNQRMFEMRKIVC